MTLFRNWNEPYRPKALIRRAPDRATFGTRRRNEGAGASVEPAKEKVVMVQDNTAELPEGTDTIIEGASGDSATLNTTLVEDGPVPRKTASDNGIADRLRAGSEKLSSQAGERARGLVGQGLERSSEALANVAKLVGETAPGIEERLGAE